MIVELNDRQAFAIDSMRFSHRSQHLYEGAAAGGKAGCGLYWLEFSGDLKPYKPLTQADVEDLLRKGLLAPRWDDKPELHYYRYRGGDNSSCSGD